MDEIEQKLPVTGYKLKPVTGYWLLVTS